MKGNTVWVRINT